LSAPPIPPQIGNVNDFAAELMEDRREPHQPGTDRDLVAAPPASTPLHERAAEHGRIECRFREVGRIPIDLAAIYGGKRPEMKLVIVAGNGCRDV